MSEVIHVPDAGTLKDLIDTEEVLVVKFTAPSWCVPCRQFAPHYEKAADIAMFKSDMSGLATFAAVDIDEVPDVVLDYGVLGVPTVMLFKNGQYVRDLKGRTVVTLLSEINI